MSSERDDARRLILARRARFVAAALAGVGVACGKEPGPPPEPCLSVTAPARYDGGWDAPRGYDRFRPALEDASSRWLEQRFDEEFLEDDMGAGGFSPLPWDREPGDDEIRQHVWQCLRDDGYVDAGAIEVDVSDRVVTLRGEVASYLEARYAWDDAWEAEGVRGVVSKLEVRDEPREEAPADATRVAADSPKPKRAGRERR